MTCHEFQGRISREIAGTLSSGVQQHLAACPACKTHWEEELRLDLLSRKALRPLQLDRDLTGDIIDRLGDTTPEEGVFYEPESKHRWVFKAALAASFLILIVTAYLTWNKQTPKERSLPTTDANIPTKPFDSAQGRPNEVTVEKDGIMVTLRSDKREYELGETIKVTAEEPEGIKEAQGVFMLYDSRGDKFDLDRQFPGSATVTDNHSTLVHQKVIQLNTDAPDTYRLSWFLSVAKDELAKKENRLIEFSLSISFTVRRKDEKEGEDITLAPLKLFIPVDWKHVSEQGKDTLVGYIITAGGLKIRYDIGPFAGKYADPSKHAEYGWLNTDQINGLTYHWAGPKNSKNTILITFPDLGPANFRFEVDDKQAIGKGVPDLIWALNPRRLGTQPDLSTPEKAWEAILAALKSGDEDQLKTVTTEKGLESLGYKEQMAVGEPVEETVTTEGLRLRYRLFQGRSKEQRDRDKVLQEVVSIVQKRCDLTRVSPKTRITVTSEGEDHIVVLIPIGADPAGYRQVMKSVGDLELCEVASKEIHDANPDDTQAPPTGWRWVVNTEKYASDKFAEREKILIKEEPIIIHRYIDPVRTTAVQGFGGEWYVEFALNTEGAARLKEATTRLKNKGYIAIILDGKLISRPFVRGVISDRGQISGESKDKAERLAIILRSGSLPAPLGKIVNNMEDLKKTGQTWSSWIMSWSEKKAESARADLEMPSPKQPGGDVSVYFVKTTEGWKLRSVMHGE